MPKFLCCFMIKVLLVCCFSAMAEDQGTLLEELDERERENGR